MLALMVVPTIGSPVKTTSVFAQSCCRTAREDAVSALSVTDESSHRFSEGLSARMFDGKEGWSSSWSASWGRSCSEGILSGSVMLSFSNWPSFGSSLEASESPLFVEGAADMLGWLGDSPSDASAAACAVGIALSRRQAVSPADASAFQNGVCVRSMARLLVRKAGLENCLLLRGRKGSAAKVRAARAR